MTPVQGSNYESAPGRNVWSGYVSGEQGCRRAQTVVPSGAYKAIWLWGKRREV